MADQNSNGAAPANAATAPSYSLVGQYTRDLSFENPGAPGSVMLGGANPNFTVGINGTCTQKKVLVVHIPNTSLLGTSNQILPAYK
jgi:preprotein translocase subunit SecB